MFAIQDFYPKKKVHINRGGAKKYAVKREMTHCLSGSLWAGLNALDMTGASELIRT